MYIGYSDEERLARVMLPLKFWPVWPESAWMYVSVQTTHIDSDLCWCDPIVDVDENGQQLVIHKEGALDFGLPAGC